MKLITKRFVWPNINRAVRNWARAYLQRQRAKTHRHTNALLGKFPDPEARFHYVHVDLVGPLPTKTCRCGASFIFSFCHAIN